MSPSWSVSRMYQVALLAEGVGRNPQLHEAVKDADAVALLAEGVGRNDPAIRDPFAEQGRPPRGGRG